MMSMVAILLLVSGFFIGLEVGRIVEQINRRQFLRRMSDFIQTTIAADARRERSEIEAAISELERLINQRREDR